MSAKHVQLRSVSTFHSKQSIHVKLLNPPNMKKWSGGALIGTLFMLLLIRYAIMEKSSDQTPFPPIALNSTITMPLESIQDPVDLSLQAEDYANVNQEIVSSDELVSDLFQNINFSHEKLDSLSTWRCMQDLLNYSQALPNAVYAIKEAGNAWKNLTNAIENRKDDVSNGSISHQVQEKQCPRFLKGQVTGKGSNRGFKLHIPCGLVQGSSITVIGIPNGLLGEFRIELIGEPLEEEPDPPIILHYNVRPLGDKLTDDPVIVQNTWTAADDWGEEERCPSPEYTKGTDDYRNVVNLNNCDEMLNVGSSSSSKLNNTSAAAHKFPFKLGQLAVMTLRVGEEGIHMTVDGKHTTSFAFRENLESWLVTQVKISGELDLISVLATGLPASEGIENNDNIQSLSSILLPLHQTLDLFIGVFSTANNFKRRMAVRKAWMQYPAVRSGTVAVHFFVGLHKNHRVNEELWKEAQMYRDIQLMPFIDYYTLITLKTIAICIFATEVVSAKYVMKTDDDAFVRVDELLVSLNRTNVTNGLLYGLIEYEALPHRTPDSKWYITFKEWSEYRYPPWAHGPGYVVSHDIANAIAQKRKGQLKMFRLEDVAMGIWIAEMQREGGVEVSYVNEPRVNNEGCVEGYVVAHYQSPRDMLCLWRKLQQGSGAKCCDDDEDR